MERRLKLRLLHPSVTEWSDLLAEDVLARFCRTLEAGRRGTLWRVEPLGDPARYGWQARTERSDRWQRLVLSASSEAEQPADVEWTLTIDSGAREGATLRGGEWAIGAALGLAAFLGAHRAVGPLPALVGAVVVLLVCGRVLPRLIRRPAYASNGVPDAVDAELLERVRRGAELFPSFQPVGDWQDSA